jgi:hypothetical protein
MPPKRSELGKEMGGIFPGSQTLDVVPLPPTASTVKSHFKYNQQIENDGFVRIRAALSSHTT